MSRAFKLEADAAVNLASGADCGRLSKALVHPIQLNREKTESIAPVDLGSGSLLLFGNASIVGEVELVLVIGDLGFL